MDRNSITSTWLQLFVGIFSFSIKHDYLLLEWRLRSFVICLTQSHGQRGVKYSEDLRNDYPWMSSFKHLIRDVEESNLMLRNEINITNARLKVKLQSSWKSRIMYTVW